MLLLKPKITCEEAIKLLNDFALGPLNDVQNAIPHSGSPDYFPLLKTAVVKYDRLTEEMMRTMRPVFAGEQVAGRARSGRYRFIMSAEMAGGNVDTLLYAELDELRRYLTYDLANELREQQERYRHHEGRRTLVLDGNDALHYSRFDKIPWAKLYGGACVIVWPHVIVDEIDAKGYSTGSESIRRRARGVYRLFEQLQDEMDEKGYATLQDGTIVEIVADEIDHVRLSNNDNEAVACAGRLQQCLGPGRVTVITRDIGVRARARSWALRAKPLPERYLIPGGGFTAKELDAALAEITSPHD